MSEDTPRSAEEIFQAAADLPSEERVRFVDTQCAGDLRLRADVISLLHHFEAAGEEFLARPAYDPQWARDFEVPERIGQYRIVQRLGEGGMGVVFEAEQYAPRRLVALKVIRPGLHGPDVRRRFEFEAEVLARLHHPFIAHVYDAGVVEVGRGEGIAIPLPYFAMELVRGPSIDRWVREHSASTRVIVELVAKVADAVEVAHQRGVIHRDLKPANVVVDDQGDPKVLDFGLARTVELGVARTLETGTGTILGTLPYISPEQLTGDPSSVDTRTDVYSLGVILLELLIGAPPVDLSDLPLPEAIRRLREEPLPRPSQRRVRVDDELDTIVRRATTREPERRYPSSGALAEDLRRYLRGDPIEAKRDSGWYVVRKQIGRHRLAFGAALSFVVLLVVASVVGFALYVRADAARHEATQQLWRAQLQQARAARESDAVGRRFRSLEAVAAAASVRPDRALRDEAVACMALDDLELQQLVPYRGTTATARGLARIDRVAELFDDGRVLVRFLHDAARSPSELVAPQSSPRRAVWAEFDASGKWLAVQHFEENRTRLRVWRTSDPQLVLELDDADFAVRLLCFARTSSAEPVLVVGDEEGTLRSIEIPTGRLLGATRGLASPVRIAADASGRRIAVSGRSEDRVVLLDPGDLRPIGTFENGAPAYALAFDHTGRRMVTGGSDHLVRVIDLERGRVAFTLEGHQAAVVEAGTMRNGTLAVTGSWDQTVRFWDLEEGREVFSPLKSVEINSVADRIVLRQPGSHLEVWRYEAGTEVVKLVHDARLGAPIGALLTYDGSTAYVAGAVGVIEWDVANMRTRRVLLDEPVRGIALDEVRGVLAASHAERVVEIDLTGMRAPRELMSGFRFEEITAHPDGWVAASRERVCSFGTDGEVKVYPALAGASSIAVSNDRSWLFVGTWRGEPARLMDLSTSITVQEFAGTHVRGVFDPNSRWLAVVDGENVRVMDLRTQEIIHHTPRGFPGNGLAGPAQFSPDARLFAVALDPYRVEIYGTDTFESILTLPNPQFINIGRIDFSGDGRRMLLAGSGTRAMVWDLERVRAGLRALGLDWEWRERSAAEE
jgi:eukaryotic-like serine/threonine-protein kinase